MPTKPTAIWLSFLQAFATTVITSNDPANVSAIFYAFNAAIETAVISTFKYTFYPTYETT
jgi:hypothetical protein